MPNKTSHYNLKKIPQSLFYKKMKLNGKNEKLCVYQKIKPIFCSKIYGKFHHLTVKDAKSAVTDRQTDQRMRVMEYPSSAK